MTTVLQIVNGAAAKVGVKTAESSLEAEDFQIIVDEMNDLLVSWANKGLTPTFTEVTEATDLVDVDRDAVAAIKNHLAIRIAPSFQKVVQPSLVAIADATLRELEVSMVHIGKVAFPDTLPMGSGNDCWADDYRFYPANKTRNF